MPEIQKLLDNNLRWADETMVRDPHFFDTLSKQQTPMYLWIGCSDSRVPANQIVDLLSIPNDKGVTSRRRTSFTSPCNTPA